MFIERCLPLFQRQCDRGLITQKEYEEIVDGTFLRDYLTKKVYDYDEALRAGFLDGSGPNQEQNELLAEMKPGDEYWHWHNNGPPFAWRSGYAVLRDGKVIGYWVGARGSPSVGHFYGSPRLTRSYLSAYTRKPPSATIPSEL
jgi:hypothetical protein